jgi:homoserine dehydrogenase
MNPLHTHPAGGDGSFPISAICEKRAGILESTGISARALSSSASGQLRLRLVAEAQRSAIGFTYRVIPSAIPFTDFLADTRGAENRLEIFTSDRGVHRLSGLGSGRVPTATTVFADILEHARALETQDLTGTEPAGQLIATGNQ